MKRADMHTGDLVAWWDFKDGYGNPGVIVIPKAATTLYGGRYKLATMGGSKYLLLAPKSHEPGKTVRKLIDARVEAEGERGADFWGVGTVVLEHVERVREQLEAGETVDTDDCPEGWSLRLVTGSLIRGAYPELHRVDAARQRGVQERVEQENISRAENKARLDKIIERLLARDLPSGFTDRVRFRAWNPADPEPLVDVPLSLLELLLDDGER